MVIDRTLILRKLADLDRHRGELREYEGISAADYSADWKTQRIVERTLQMAIEICADIASHIVAEDRLRVAESVADTFRSIAEAGILPPELLPRMERMAGFRNLVVHRYGQIDAAMVTTILRQRLDDFIAFGDAIIAYLQGRDPGA